MDASSLWTLASHRLCHRQEEGQAGRTSHEGHVRRRVLDRPPPYRLQTQPPHPAQETASGHETPKRLNVNKLELGNIKQNFADTLEERLESTVLDNQNVEAAWGALHETVYNTAMECLRPSARKHKDWFDENCTEIKQLLEVKRQAYRAHIEDPKSQSKKDILKSARSTIQLKLRQMQDSWLSNKADGIQGSADRNDMKNFYNGLKEVYGPTTSGSAPLLSADGSTLITDKDGILERWADTLTSY
ncbi:uncharacterized protein LOC143300678 [Babylonia areolata]|uniref:uncharacterized protein LOC143300678 n=1 Tax=Babylonia areolata TaxID=304850 RepID=UPI003FD2CFE8